MKSTEWPKHRTPTGRREEAGPGHWVGAFRIYAKEFESDNSTELNASLLEQKAAPTRVRRSQVDYNEDRKSSLLSASRPSVLSTRADKSPIGRVCREHRRMCHFRHFIDYGPYFDIYK